MKKTIKNLFHSFFDRLKKNSFLIDGILYIKNHKWFMVVTQSKWFITLTKRKEFQKIKSYFSTIGLSLFLTLGLFFLMSVLISGGGDLNRRSSDSYFINFLMNPSLEDLEIRSRRIPKKPKEPESPPEMPKMKVMANVPEPPQLKAEPLPELTLTKDFTSDPMGAAVGGSYSGDSEVTPIVRMEPLYPRKAAMRGLEGFVVLKFDITRLGTVSGVVVLQASPPQVFNQSAKQSLLRWKYKPKVVEGKPVEQKNLKVKLEFKLEKDRR